MKCGVVDDNAALRHHLFEVAQVERVSQIPADALGNNIDRIMQAFERISDQRYRQATSQKKQHVT